MEGIFKGNSTYNQKLESLTVGDEICFSKDTLEMKRYGARVTGAKQIRATIMSEGFVEHRQKKIYLLYPETGTNALLLYESTILRYGAYKKIKKEESVQIKMAS